MRDYIRWAKYTSCYAYCGATILAGRIFWADFQLRKFSLIIFLWIIKTVDHYGSVSSAARDVQLFTFN